MIKAETLSVVCNFTDDLDVPENDFGVKLSVKKV